MIPLDPLIQNAKPGDVIQLEAGTYYTLGCDDSLSGTVLPEGCTLKGASMNTTSIQWLAPRVWDRSHVMLGTRGNCIVQDVTIFTRNWDSSHQFKVNGLSMLGDNCTANRVTVRGASGWRGAHKEGFGIGIHKALGTDLSLNGSITGCQVFGSIGDYVTGIKIDDGLIDSCIASGNLFTAFGVCHAPHATITRCMGADAVNGIYLDTGVVEKLTVSHVSLLSVRYGVHINAQTDEVRTVTKADLSTLTVQLRAGLPDVAGLLIDRSGPGTVLNAIDQVSVSSLSLSAVGNDPAQLVYAVNVASPLTPSGPAFGRLTLDGVTVAGPHNWRWRCAPREGVREILDSGVQQPLQWTT